MFYLFYLQRERRQGKAKKRDGKDPFVSLSYAYPIERVEQDGTGGDPRLSRRRRTGIEGGSTYQFDPFYRSILRHRHQPVPEVFVICVARARVRQVKKYRQHAPQVPRVTSAKVGWREGGKVDRIIRLMFGIVMLLPVIEVKQTQRARSAYGCL
jgi:hypothetical protein